MAQPITGHCHKPGDFSKESDFGFVLNVKGKCVNSASVTDCVNGRNVIQQFKQMKH